LTFLEPQHLGTTGPPKAGSIGGAIKDTRLGADAAASNDGDASTPEVVAAIVLLLGIAAFVDIGIVRAMRFLATLAARGHEPETCEKKPVATKGGH
jgi:hypothetical protein